MEHDVGLYKVSKDHDYLEFVYWTINTYFPEHKYDEDFFQEACIGLISAKKDYKFDRGMSFKSFAILRIKSRCINILKKRLRKKNHVEAISLNYVEKNSSKELIDMLADNSSDFENALMDDIYTTQLIEKLKSKLNERDGNILDCLLTDKPLTEISIQVGYSRINGAHKRIKTIRQAYKEVIHEMGDNNETRQKSNKGTEN